MPLDINKVNFNEKESSVYSELQDKILSMEDIKIWIETHRTFLESQPDLFSGNYTKKSMFFRDIYYILRRCLEVGSYNSITTKALDTFRDDFTEKELLDWLYDYEELGVEIYDFVIYYGKIEKEDCIEIQDGGKNINISIVELKNTFTFNKIFKKLYWFRLKRLTRKVFTYYENNEPIYFMNSPYPTLRELYEGIIFTKAEPSTLAERIREYRKKG